MIKGFIGKTKEGTIEYIVEINGYYLDPEESLQVYNHSPNGFSWGYGGSGPAQLALAILLRFCKKDDAIRLHQAFKWNVIARLPADREWQLPNSFIHEWIESVSKDTNIIKREVL